MLIEVLAAAFELVAGEPDADEIDSHGELLVLGLYLAVAGVLLRQRLVVHRQSEHDVGPYLSGVERAVKAAQLHRVIAVEEAVQIEKVVAAVVVVRIAGSTILAVPRMSIRSTFRTLRFLTTARPSGGKYRSVMQS